MSIILIPFLIFAGRLLPLAYSLLDKKRDDYGKICGRLYFYNTLGTVIGSIVFAHLLCYFFNLDILFKINIALMFALLVLLVFMHKRKSWGIALLGTLILFVLFFPSWNRYSHQSGLFRYREVEDYHFKGFFSIPENSGEVLYFKDDPNATVTVIESNSQSNLGRSIIVNGKSDGHTFGNDYSTMLLLGSLAYLHAPPNEKLQAAVVGFGTGITAGILGVGKDVDHVSVLEISPSVIDAAGFFHVSNFSAITNPKIEIIQDDAFRFLTREAQHSKIFFDMIVSEPSNPWVVGVENLFTLSFYNIVKKVLKPEGVFVQWLQLYEIDRPIVLSVISNLVKSFKHIKIYQVSSADLAIVASDEPISHKSFIKRFVEPSIFEAHQKISVINPEQFVLQVLYEEPELKKLVSSFSSEEIHDFETPKIGYAAGKQMFLGQVVDGNKILDDDVARLVRYRPELTKAIDRLVGIFPEGLKSCDNPSLPPSVFCSRFDKLKKQFILVIRSPEENSELDILTAYQDLREAGIYPADFKFLKKIENRILSKTEQTNLEHQVLIALYLTQLVREGLHLELEQAIKKFRQLGSLNESDIERLSLLISDVENKIQRFLKN
jgi:spermidine synthase